MYICASHAGSLYSVIKESTLSSVIQSVSPGLFLCFHCHHWSYCSLSDGNWAIKITWGEEGLSFFFFFSIQSCSYKLSVFQYLPSTKWTLCWAATLLPEGINVAFYKWNTVISRAISSHWHSNRGVRWPGCWGAALFDCRLMMSSLILLLFIRVFVFFWGLVYAEGHFFFLLRLCLRSNLLQITGI